jgi:hypothetical protein
MTNKIEIRSHSLGDSFSGQSSPDMSGEEAAAFMVQERSRFMIACKGDEKEAIKRLKETAAFLYPDDGEGNLLDSNFQHFFFLKKVYPHGFLGRSKMGSFVFLDKMGIFHHTMKELRKHNIGKVTFVCFKKSTTCECIA